MSFQVARNIDMVRDVADFYEVDPRVLRDRDEDDMYADSLDDEAFERDVDLSEETPDDRRTNIALMARREWMETR